MIKKIFNTLYCLLFLATVVFAADYGDNRRVDQLAQPSGTITPETWLIMQDPGDTDKVVAEEINKILAINTTVTSGAPGANHDEDNTTSPPTPNKVYNVGDKWHNTATNVWYICRDATDGAAVWDTFTSGDPEAYDTSGWDADTSAATKNDIRDYLVTLDSDADGAADSVEATAVIEVSTDTTPQLGGDLDLNSKNIDFPTTANVSDVVAAVGDPGTDANLVTEQGIREEFDTFDAAKLDDVVDDTTPQLGGPLDMNDQTVVESTNVLADDGTPPVAGGLFWSTGAANTYTDFLDSGDDDHSEFTKERLLIIRADHTATLDCTGSNIICNEGENLTLAVGDMVLCIFDVTADKWSCMSSNDNDSGGSPAWNSVEDATGNVDLDVGGYTQIIRGDRDQATSSENIRFYDDDTDGKTNDHYIATFSHKSSADGEAHFARGLDNDTDGASGTQRWWIDYEGVYHGPGMKLDSVSSPKWTWMDDDAAGTDEDDERAGRFYANLSQVTEDSEISDHRETFMSDIADPSEEHTWIGFDGSDFAFYMGVLTNNWSFAEVTLYESLKWDFNTSTDAEIAVTSPSSSWLNFTGVDTSIGALTPVADDADNFGSNFTGKNLYGGTFVASATGTANLPAVAAGMYFSVLVPTAIAVDFNPNGTEIISLNGADESAGENIDNGSVAGTMCTFQYYASGKWLAFCDENWTGE